MSDIKHQEVYKDTDCEIYLEPFEDKLLIHCYIHNWTKGLVLKYDIIFLQLKKGLAAKGFTELYAAILPSDNKLKRFSNMFGFSKTEDRILDDSKRVRELYKCSI